MNLIIFLIKNKLLNLLLNNVLKKERFHEIEIQVTIFYNQDLKKLLGFKSKIIFKLKNKNNYKLSLLK